MKINIIDRQTQETIGTVITNHSLTTDEIMSLSGFEWVEGDNETGWTKDGRTFYDESTVDMESE